MNIICYLVPRGPNSNAPLFYGALQQAQIQPPTPASCLDVAGLWSWPDVRGKYTATAVHDSDMNTVYLTGLCIRTHTFHSDLSVNLAPDLPKARRLDCFVMSLFQSDKVLYSGICIRVKQQAIDCEFSPNARLSGFGVCACCC